MNVFLDRPTVLCVGELLFDAIAPPRRDGSGPRERYAGGAPANVAVALRRLGVRSAFLGCIGRDEDGEALLAALAREGVDLRAVQRSDAPTRVVEVDRDDRDERVFAGFIGGGAPGSFADAQLACAALPGDLLEGMRTVVVGSVSLAYPRSCETVTAVVRAAHARGIPIAYDLNRRPVFWPEEEQAAESERAVFLANHATYLKAAEGEAYDLFGSDDPPALLAAFPQLHGVWITRGRFGVRYALRGGAHGDVPGFPVDARDTTGAGDAFVAGLVAAVLGDGFPDAPDDAFALARAASAVGALATTALGAFAAMPARKAVHAFLEARS